MEVLYRVPRLLYLGVFTISLALSLLLTPLAKRLAIRFDIVDRPGGRKIHNRVIPYLGGLAIYAAFWLALCLLAPGYLQQLTAIVLAGTVVMLLGLWDDRSGMDPVTKLAGQAVGALIVLGAGIHFNFAPYAVLNWTLSLFWIVGLSNAMNLLDNMDGLSGGSTLISSFFIFVLAASNGQYLVAAMALSLMGACLGFLRYNFAPASIFMGDAGSLFLGFMTSVICLKLRPTVDSDALNLLVPATLLGLPILDTTLVFIQRTLNGRRFYEGGKDHLSHRLVLMGHTRITAVLVLYLVSVSYGLLSVALNSLGLDKLVLALVAVYSMFLFVRFSSVAAYPVESAPLPVTEVAGDFPQPRDH